LPSILKTLAGIVVIFIDLSAFFITLLIDENPFERVLSDHSLEHRLNQINASSPTRPIVPSLPSRLSALPPAKESFPLCVAGEQVKQ